jgi:hypothetical protein
MLINKQFLVAANRPRIIGWAGRRADFTAGEQLTNLLGVVSAAVANCNWEIEGRKKDKKQDTVKKGTAGDAHHNKFDDAD